MKKNLVFITELFVVVVLLASGCTQSPTVSDREDTPAVSPPTERAPVTETAEVPTPAAAPTQPPVFPCDIVFDSDRDANLEIYRMAPDGSGLVNLTNHPADDTEPVWSPDGTHIAFVSNRENESEGGLNIYVMRADGSDVARITNQNDSRYPDWSPSGNRIAFSSQGDIFIVDASGEHETNLTNSPEEDSQPKISPDGQQIAWLKGGENNRQLFVMDLDGQNARQLTFEGPIFGIAWSVDGRIFANWDNPTGLCRNCLITADGAQVADAGGKGAIASFLPVWTAEGYRVEMAQGDIKGEGNEDIFLVSEKFADMFLVLTDNLGNDRNPDTAFRCGPTRGVYPQFGADGTEPSDRTFVIGYTGSISPQIKYDLDVACSELSLQCVKGESISELADQGVDAIINASNQWDVMGSFPQTEDAVRRGVPVFFLNAESDVKGVFNLSAENGIYSTTLNWMFSRMNGEGDFVYYNFGNNDKIQSYVDEALKAYPGITAIKKDADYEGDSFTKEDIQMLISENPNLGAIWATNKLENIFWGINNESNPHLPVTECMARLDQLIDWKILMDSGSDFQCISHIRPGGTAYEGVYVAYYYLSGYAFRSDAFISEDSTTLRYDIPPIENENLPEWIGPKLDTMRVGDGDILALPPMTPKEILERWFVK